MPKFPGPVRHNNPKDVILDLTQNQIKGIGLFPDITTADTGRSDLPELLRTQGYIATTTISPSTHVYTGATTGDQDWQNTNNWSNIGSSGLPEAGEQYEILAMGESVASWSSDIKPKGITVRNHGAEPNDCVLAFSKKDTNAVTAAGDILGEIKAEGFGTMGVRSGGPQIRFVAGSDAGPTSTYQSSGIEFYTSDNSGSNRVLTLNTNKSVTFSTDTIDPPVASVGSMYYNSSNDNFYISKQTI